MEKVSVIMPAYNAEKTISDAVRSVELQTYKNFELIIVDDGSVDGTAVIVDSMSEKDDRIRVIHTNNGGVSNARNIGLKNSEGKYIAFIDADDRMTPNMLHDMVRAMQVDVDLVCGGFEVVAHTGKKLFEQTLTDKCVDNKCYDEAIAELQDKKALNVLWNKLFRNSIIEKYNIKMDSNISMGEDFLFVIDYLSCMKGKVRCLSDVVYKYTLSPKGAQATKKYENSVRERIDQLYKFEHLYIRENYNLNSLYAEQLRCIYTSLVETEDIGGTMKLIYEDERNIKLLNAYRPQGVKFSFFVLLLKSHNRMLISIGVFGFKVFKRIKGTSFQWN